jgi:hypothetical protein
VYACIVGRRSCVEAFTLTLIVLVSIIIHIIPLDRRFVKACSEKSLEG